ncbi:MAG TPA: hypothetical protein VFN61_13460 [Acidimicrobiales bacterium]|nr:hypothetical protein [Acidimicrobiales bacterium]
MPIRDLDHLRRLAVSEGPSIGAYADALLDSLLLWTKMRQVYALLGLVNRWGAPTVEATCARALEAEAVNVGLMIERATENQATPKARPTGRTPRFARGETTRRSLSGHDRADAGPGQQMGAARRTSTWICSVSSAAPCSQANARRAVARSAVVVANASEL